MYPWISMNSVDTLTESTPWFYQPVLCTSLDGQSIQGFHGYFDKGYPQVLLLCTSLDGQSIHGFHRYFDRGYPLVLPANTTLYSMDSVDTTVSLKVTHSGDTTCYGVRVFCGGSHGFRGYFDTGYPLVLLLCTSLDDQSIHGFHGYFDRGSTSQYYFVYPWLVRVSMDSMDTLIEGTPLLCTFLERQSINGFRGYFDKGYPLPILLCTSLGSQSIHGFCKIYGQRGTYHSQYFVHPWMNLYHAS